MIKLTNKTRGDVFKRDIPFFFKKRQYEFVTYTEFVERNNHH